MNTERVDAGDEYVEAQVKLGLVNQVWLGYVPIIYALEKTKDVKSTNLCTSNGLVLGI